MNVTIYKGNAFFIAPDNGTLTAAPIAADGRILWDDATDVDAANFDAEELQAEAAAMLTRIAEIDLTAARNRHPSRIRVANV